MKNTLIVMYSTVLDLSGLDLSKIFVHFSPHAPKGIANVYVLEASPLCKDMSENAAFVETIFYDRHFIGFSVRIKNLTDIARAFPDYEVTYVNPDAPTEQRLHGDHLL